MHHRSNLARQINGLRLVSIALIVGIAASATGWMTFYGTATGSESTLEHGSQTWTVDVDGTPRSFRIYIPEQLTLVQSVPLVVMLHGGFGSAKQAESAYDWDTMAKIGGFVVAFPNGDGRAWNGGGGCCGEPGRTDRDDVAFIVDMVDLIEARIPIDEDRVFATGMSNGAIMSYRLACETDRFAAIAAVAGTQLVPCENADPVSVLAIHGLEDESVPFNGDKGSGFAKIDGPAVPEVISFWQDVDQCGEPVTVSVGDVTDSYAGCPGGRAVELLAIANMGHTWPAGGRGSIARVITSINGGDDIIATIAIWDFFESHPRM